MAGKQKGKNKKDKKVKKASILKWGRIDYVNCITELNRKLAELRNENNKLENNFVQIENKFRERTLDLRDVQEYLNKMINKMQAEIDEMNKVIDSLSKQIKEKEDYYEEILRKMLEDFQAKVKEIQEKIGQIKFQLMTMGTVRQMLKNHEEKIAKLEAEKAEQENKHKTELYETEKFMIKEEGALQKEMEKPLAKLKHDVKEASHMKINIYSNNACKSNILLSNAVNCYHDALKKVYVDYDKAVLSATNTEYKLKLVNEKCEVANTCLNDRLSQVRTYIETLHELSNRVTKLNKKLKKLAGHEAQRKKTETMLDRTVNRIVKLEKDLEQKVEVFKVIREDAGVHKRNTMKFFRLVLDVALEIQQAIEAKSLAQYQRIEVVEDDFESEDEQRIRLKEELLEKAYKLREMRLYNVSVILQKNLLNKDEADRMRMSTISFQMDRYSTMSLDASSASTMTINRFRTAKELKQTWLRQSKIVIQRRMSFMRQKLKSKVNEE